MTDIKLEDEKLDPRIRRTRNYIQEAFQSLLEEKSFKSITVREITERAEVNRATFYAHHKDKYELLNETLRTIFQEELEHRALNVCHYSQANLRALVMTVCEFIRDSSSNCKTVDSQFELIVENQVRQQIQELLELWLEKMAAAGTGPQVHCRGNELDDLWPGRTVGPGGAQRGSGSLRG